MRPYTSAFGLDNNILDVPRNVTIISREQLDTVDIQDVRDFSKLTSSSYTTTNFGAPSNPSIRGQTADTFTNGLRTGITSNGNGLPIDFNAIESVSILKGPAPVIYGPSPYVGGFVNFVTKQPYFDKWQGFVGTTVGEYDQISLDGRRERPAHQGQAGAAPELFRRGKRQLLRERPQEHPGPLFRALAATPLPWYSATLTSEFFIADYTENFGINRPTQNLINNNKYIVGTPIDSTTGAVLPYPAGVESGFNFIPTGDTVNIGSGDGRKERLLATGDGSLGRSDTITLIQTARINDHLSIVNSSLGLIIDRTTRSSYRYQEQEPDNIAIENRTEARINFEVPFGGGGYVRNPPPDKKDGKRHGQGRQGGGRRHEGVRTLQDRQSDQHRLRLPLPAHPRRGRLLPRAGQRVRRDGRPQPDPVPNQQGGDRLQRVPAVRGRLRDAGRQLRV